MSEPRPFLKRPQTYVVMVVIALALSLLGFLSQLGFEFAQLLKGQTSINFCIAVVCAFVGFMNSYRLLSAHRELSILAAAYVYISLGFAMGGVYYMVHVSHTGCFGLPADIQAGASIIDFIYFSFVTATTIGYGDMVPRHTFIRMLVLLHVLFTMYLVIAATRKG